MITYDDIAELQTAKLRKGERKSWDCVYSLLNDLQSVDTEILEDLRRIILIHTSPNWTARSNELHKVINLLKEIKI